MLRNRPQVIPHSVHFGGAVAGADLRLVSVDCNSPHPKGNFATLRSGRAHALESYAALWPPITSSGLAFLMLPRRYLYSLTLTRCEAGSRRETRAQVMPLRLPPFGCCGLSALLVHDLFLHWFSHPIIGAFQLA